MNDQPSNPQPSSQQPSTKVFAFRVGLGLSVLGVLLLETGIPGLIVLVVGVISLTFSGFFDKFMPHK